MFKGFNAKQGEFVRAVCSFNACSFSGNAGTRRDDKDAAELFAVLNLETGDVYVIPVKEVGHTVASLRLNSTLSG